MDYKPSIANLKESSSAGYIHFPKPPPKKQPPSPSFISAAVPVSHLSSAVKEKNLHTTAASVAPPNFSNLRHQQNPKPKSNINPSIKSAPEVITLSDEDIEDACKVKRKPHKRTIGIAGFKTVQIPGPNGNPIRAKRYNAIMPPPDNTNRNDLFIPPDLQQLQHYLILLDLPPELAYNSPLLISLAIEPEGRSPVTIDTR
uniref:Uncharacterized protein n=1 Tax=Panagrolaimus sp. PS1159 TaxID=55785 RepID=A0AC35GTX2_9BILA